MIVQFRTNLDQYQKCNLFSTGDTWNQVPRKGDYVKIRSEYLGYYLGKKLPTQLEVTSVTWFESPEGEVVATCELWYNKTDLELAKLSNAPVFG